MATISARSDEDQIALRDGVRWVPRLVPHRVEGGGARFDPDARYVITGGLGHLALVIARWAVARGARKLVLISRRRLEGAAGERIAELREAGAEVEHVRADVTDGAAMEAVFATPGQPAARGVFHLAGTAGMTETADLAYETFLEVMRPKVTGTRILHQAAAAHPLDFFFCASSLSSIWGYKGGFHYAAANAFQDAFMQYRRGCGLPGLALDLGPLDGGGMTDPEALGMLEKIGVMPIAADLVTDALELLLDGAEPTLVARVRWQVFLAVYNTQRPSTLLSGIAAGCDQRSEEQVPAVIVDQLRAAPPSARRRLIADAVRGEVAGVLGLEPSAPEDDAGFSTMGMDSIMMVELQTRIARLFGYPLPLTVIFNQPTISSLAAYLQETIPGLAEVAPAEARPSSSAHEHLDELSEDELESLLDRAIETAPTLAERRAWDGG
ncbi:MAG: SDR family NAD(P)-dependent oxidoreductase [bacterium]|nr:SDR family NAD(P)-dependent oxidoreductase [bacterium]